MAERTGYNSTRTKNRNRGIVLRLIAAESLSRSEISGRIGLTKMAVTKIVSELIDDGFVVEGNNPSTGASGRNPTKLEISPLAPLAIGLYVSRDSVSLTVASIDLVSLFSDSVTLQGENAETLTSKIFTLCDRAFGTIEKRFANRRLLGIGVCSIGPLDPHSGVILDPTNFFGITDYPVCALLKERYGVPVILENDMNAAALAERTYGACKQTANFMYLGITNGIGAGIILEGRPCLPNSITVGEIGHMSICFDGPRCSCGNNGCLEVYANMPVICKRISDRLRVRALPAQFALYAGDQGCAEIFDDVAQKLACAIANSVNFLDLETVVIGHEGIYLPDSCLMQTERLVNERILSKGYSRVLVVRSTFGAGAPLHGSACIVFDKLFAGENLI